MLTINEIKRNPSQVFARQTDEGKKLNFEMLKYIEFLATASSTNISMWDIKDIFGDKENKKVSLEIVKNKNEINKLFYANKDKMASGSTEEIQNIVKIIGDSIGTALEAQKSGRITSLENNILSKRRNIEDYIRQMSQRISDIVSYRKELDTLENISTRDKIMADIEEVLKGNFYAFESFENNILTLTTKENVMSTLVNAKAGLNLNVNLGKFKVKLNLVNFELKVLPHSGNMKLNDHIHPYVGGSGDVCFGNGQARASTLLETMNISGVMTLLAAILTTFSEDSTPFVSLNSFKIEADRLAKGLPPSDEAEEDEETEETDEDVDY